MSEVTVSIIMAKSEDVTGTEMAGRKPKMENWAGTERLSLTAKHPQLVPTYGPPALLLDEVLSLQEKRSCSSSPPRPPPGTVSRK